MLDVLYAEYGYSPELRDRPLREVHMMIDTILARHGINRQRRAPVDLAALLAKHGVN